MIEVKHLTKQYGDKLAVNDISFTVEDGEILGLLGPNGAGKSTTMNMLTGYISSTSGQALINGIDILEDPIKAKAQIGYLPELPPLYLDMTVMGYLNFVYDLKKVQAAPPFPSERRVQPVPHQRRFRSCHQAPVQGLPPACRSGTGTDQQPADPDSGRAHCRSGPEADH